MKYSATYLNFDGNAREAMQFYEKALGAKLQMMSFADARVPNLPPAAGNRLMHARLTKGPVTIMASDTMPGMAFQKGNNFAVMVDCESAAEAERLFKALSDKGQVTMPLAETF